MKNKRVMVNVITRPDGTDVTVPLLRERFRHFDMDNDEPTLKFQNLNGWSILERLVPLIIFFRPGCIVEIGAGASTIHLARIAEEYGVRLYSCDKSPRKFNVYFKNHIFVQQFSHNFIDNFDDEPAVVLIDADHKYEVARMEFDFFFEKLLPGGVIFLHDTMPPHKEYLRETACADVYRLRQDLEKRDDLDCFTWPYTAGYMGLTMVMKRYIDGEYFER